MTFTTEGSNPTSAVTNNAAIAAEIDVKASFKLQIRRFKLASDANIFTLKGRLISLFSIPAESPIVLLYKDDENDLVTMNLDEEMKYAIKVSNGLLRVEIRIEGEMQAPPSAPAADNSCDKPWKQMRKGHGPHGLHGPHGFHGHGPFCGPRSHHGPFAQAPQTETQDVESPVSKWEGRRGGRWRCSEQDASAQSGPENERGCKDRLKARHVKDITIPDGTVVLSGVPFVKTWRIRNAGTVDWPAKTRLLFISHKGDHMGGPEFVVIEGIVKAGEETDVSVNFVAPSEPGDYSGFWRMATEDGKKFGQRFWVDIKVAAADKSSSDSSDFEHIPAPIEYEKLGKQVQQMFPEVPERRIKHLLTKFGGNVNTVVEKLNARRECKVRRGGEGRRCGENKKH